MTKVKCWFRRLSWLAILWNAITFSIFMCHGLQLPDANIKKNTEEQEDD